MFTNSLKDFAASILKVVQVELSAWKKWFIVYGKYRLGSWCSEPSREENVEKFTNKGGK
jgi:hypothetical protein